MQVVTADSVVRAALALFAFGAVGENAWAFAETTETPAIEARRCKSNPLITSASDSTLGTNINGPSVIRAPDWLPDKLGRYYLYFAHHKGKHIRLAYANELCGEWKIHQPGTLRLEHTADFADHIASPDVHVDDAGQKILMYFHGKRAGGTKNQQTGLAVSRDGVSFAVTASNLGQPYFRVFELEHTIYAIAKRGNTGGVLLRALSPEGPYEEGDEIVPRMRHAAVLPWAKREVLVFYSLMSDTPERILVSSLNIGSDWRRPTISRPHDVLWPETWYEGIDVPLAASEPGPTGRAQQLRDPHVFRDEGRTWLFYSIAGESGIALAELKITSAAESDRWRGRSPSMKVPNDK